MLLADPPPSPADLHFRLFGIPVRVHPLFWIVALFLGLSGGDEPADPYRTLLWVAVVFVSILVHELGHAFLQRRYGGHPWITLYGLGGMASCDDCDRAPRSQVLISLAGPVAGFLFAAVVLAVIRLAGHEVRFGVLPSFIGWFIPAWEPFPTPTVNLLILDLLYVNIFWGLVNLLPIYPLDGGHVAREVMTLSDPHRGIVRSLWLSVVAAGAMALYGLTRNSIFVAIMFGYLAYASYQAIRAYQGSWR